MRVIAQPLSYRIPPNVGSDVFDDLLRPQNVIVVAHLPEPLATTFFEFIPRPLFESINELDQIGTLGTSFAKEVNVVGHDAIGVKTEIPLSSSFQQIRQHPFPGRWIRKEGCASLGPRSHEINPTTAVVFRRTPQPFLKKGIPGYYPSAFVEAGL